ncbi:uncharacterized protein EV422DRAFT_515108 [Fimicolochytrium jonesii]|uniref:uncharacterized protein n=1 Tax=Fimicolochytrium jonesii TaxID=1396493 RepID=UPI0022FDEE4F|nr:uncharacterized protein EV422DRAFT_515108 [Fimicolochytrium jonesii]KAI8826045.1 hypothetical protein EV422DRAFT_515108 [Fimicolochytrium jonesii]
MATPAATSATAASTKYAPLISKVLRLYTSRDPKEQQQIIETHYAPNATFEDPLMIVHGPTNIISQFHALLSFFSSIDANETPLNSIGSLKDTQPPQGESLANGELISVPNTQIYRRGEPSKPKEIPIEAVTHITVDKTSGKVLYHKDVWLNHKFENPSLVKKVSGASSSAIFKLFNVGG